MVRIDAEARAGAEARLLEPFAVGALEGDRLEQDHHDEVQAPNLVGLPQAIYSAHFALLVRVGQDAHGRFLLRDAVHKVLPAVVGDVLAELPEQPGGPLLLRFRVFVLQKKKKKVGVKLCIWKRIEPSGSKLDSSGQQRRVCPFWAREYTVLQKTEMRT